MKKFFIYTLLGLLAVSLIAGYFFYRDFKFHTNRPYMNYKKSASIHIKKGTSVYDIGKLLYLRGVISSYSYFRIFYKFNYADVKLKSGDYTFNKPLTMGEVILKLSKGQFIPYRVTIKEGKTLDEIIVFLAKNYSFSKVKLAKAFKMTSLIKDFDNEAKDLEGYILPETYFVRKGISEEQLVKIVVGKFKDIFTERMRLQARDMGFSIREIVILASLIEKETSLESERRLVASVYHNRLKKKMLLQCDPTMIYALKKAGVYNKMKWKKLGRNIDSPFNTYKFRGLPPGPICNPGKASLEAAVLPENTDFLYFVRKQRGKREHHFSKSYKEHRWAIKKSLKGWK